MSFHDFEETDFTSWEPGVDAPVAPCVFTQPCGKCRGGGRFISYAGRDCGPCFVCKGSGTQTFRTSAEARTKARTGAAARKARTVDAWIAAHPQEHAWIIARGPRFEFAAEMGAAVVKYGELTERQLATVQRLMATDVARDAQRAAEAQAKAAAAPVVSVDRIAEAFEAAQARGIKSPKLRLAGFRFSLAPASGANAGAIYVKRASDREYLGKIAQGRFLGRCEAVEAAEVVTVASDPEAAAVAYGKAFGQCSCCGRDLTNAELIARGIGPICAEKFGW